MLGWKRAVNVNQFMDILSLSSTWSSHKELSASFQ
jgi:hypothetical protein